MRQFNLIGIDDSMPIGKWKGTSLCWLVKHRPAYLRWFAETVSEYELESEIVEALQNDEVRKQLLERCKR